VKLIDEATGQEFGSRGLRFDGVPRIGECVVIPIAQGSPQSYRVRDVEWNLQGASPEDEAQLSEVRVRIRAEHAQES